MPNAKLLSPSPRENLSILSHTARDGERLACLGSGAISQRPKQVIDAEVEFLIRHNVPVHRGVYEIAEEATDAYEDAREAIAGFIGADYDELVSTKNAAEALNTVAFVFGDDRSGQHQVGGSDEIVVTELEHRMNLIPQQELARRTGAALCWYGVTGGGRIDMDPSEFSEEIGVAAFTRQSDVAGAITDAKEMMRRAHEVGALVILDACQSMSHMPIDVRDLDIGFLAFLGHKIFDPNGIGALYDHRELLEALPPFLTGDSMIEVVTMEEITFAAPPQRFKTGTTMTSQVVSLGVAVKYPDVTGMDRVAAREHRSTALALERLQEIDGMTITGSTTPEQRGSVMSFKVEGIHPHDLGQVLDDQGVCTCVGHRCAWPIRQVLNAQSTVQASFYIYNMGEGVQVLVDAMRYARKFFGVTPQLQGKKKDTKLEQMYQEIILDHYKYPQHVGLREPFNTGVHHVNPSCSDELTLRVTLDDDLTVANDVSHDAVGYSISQASTSVMAEKIVGKTVDETMVKLAEFKRMVTSRGKIEGNEDFIGDGIAFVGISKYPTRAKCVLPGWKAFQAATAETLANAAEGNGVGTTTVTVTDGKESRHYDWINR